jgi:hypothetical protein
MVYITKIVIYSPKEYKKAAFPKPCASGALSISFGTGSKHRNYSSEGVHHE